MGVVRDTCSFSTPPPPCHHRFLDLVIQEGSLSDQTAGSPRPTPIPLGAGSILGPSGTTRPSGMCYKPRLLTLVLGSATFSLFLSCLCFPCILYLHDNHRSSQVLTEIFLTQHLGRDEEIFLRFVFFILFPLTLLFIKCNILSLIY